MVNFNEADGSRHSRLPKKTAHIPEYLQLVLQQKSEELRKEGSPEASLMENPETSLMEDPEASLKEDPEASLKENPETSPEESSSSSDEEIATPLATQHIVRESPQDVIASQNKTALSRGFNSSCILYSVKRGSCDCSNKQNINNHPELWDQYLAKMGDLQDKDHVWVNHKYQYFHNYIQSQLNLYCRQIKEGSQFSTFLRRSTLPARFFLYSSISFRKRSYTR